VISTSGVNFSVNGAALDIVGNIDVNCETVDTPTVDTNGCICTTTGSI
jgi:hypothetical protein